MSVPSDVVKPAKGFVFIEGSEGVDPEKIYQKLVEESLLEDCRICLPKGHLSVSQVGMYMRCGIQYKARYILGLIRPPTAPMAEGKAVHRGLEIGHCEALKTGGVPVDVMLDAYNDSWKGIRTDIDWKIEDNSDSETDIVSRDMSFLRMYHNDYLPAVRAVVDQNGPFVERRFFVSVGELCIPLLGYIDLLAEPQTLTEVIGGNGTSLLPLIQPVVIDHKVVSKAKSQGDVREDMQLTVYSHVAKTPHVRFHSFTKTKTPAIKSVGDVRTAEDWAWVEYVIQEVAKGIAAGVFIPSAPGWSCSSKWCGYYSECRHGNLRKG